MADILNVLKSEHDQLRTLFDELNATSDDAVDTREKLLRQIEQALLPHAKWEDTVFYPAFAERAGHDGLKTHAEAVEEHKIVEKMVLPDVKGADTSSREFAGNSQVFGELIKHHAKEEESKMFDEARTLFSDSERAQFADDYAKWKDSSEAATLLAAAKAKTAVKSAFT